MQSADTFTSLASGNYLLRIYDANFDSTQTNFIVGGNYQLPDFTMVVQDVICKGDTTGSITAAVNNGTGNNPFIWTLTDNVLGTTITNSTGSFINLRGGNYTLILKDSCYNFTTKYGIIVMDGTSYIQNGYAYFHFIGCDTLSISYNYILQNSVLINSYLKTKYGVQTSTSANQNFIVPNLTYGDTVEFKGINSCNDSVLSRTIVAGT
ncbi:MAG: hypothetical protein RIQ33_2432, partial [Bacteroidota bacterium]